MLIHDAFVPTPTSQDNPFAITKAVDFSDNEINAMWVDWPAQGGFAKVHQCPISNAQNCLRRKGHRTNTSNAALLRLCASHPRWGRPNSTSDS